MGRWLDIPEATLNMILDYTSGGGDDSLCSRKCYEVYQSEHPSPSWKHVADALYVEEHLEELEVVQKKYLKGG